MDFQDFQDQDLQQGLRLPQTRRVSDAEDDEHAIALRPSLPTTLLLLISKSIQPCYQSIIVIIIMKIMICLSIQAKQRNNHSWEQQDGL